MLLPWVSIVPTDAQFWLSNNKMVVSEWAKIFFLEALCVKITTTNHRKSFTLYIIIQIAKYVV